MGLAIALEARRPSDLRLSRPLRYLAAFGILHGVVEWIEMWLIAPSLAPAALPDLRVLRLILLATSVVALAQFGADLIASIRPRMAFLRLVPVALVLFWGVNWLILPHLVPVVAEEVARTPSCLRCHSLTDIPGQRTAIIGLTPASALADVWARYVLYLPASLLAAVGFWMEGRRLVGLTYPSVAADCRLTALAFAGNAVMAGLVVPPSAFFPASVLNYDTFLSAVGIPPQLFRAGIAVIIAGLTLRVLRVFDQEAARRLARVTEERIAAQQQALDAVQEARAAAEAWSHTLEERVRARTEEIEQRTHELAALNAIATTVTSSLDLRTILESSIDHVLELVGGEGGGITLQPSTPGDPQTSVVRGPLGADIQRIRGFEAGAVALGTVSLPSGGPARPFVKVPLQSKDRLLGELTLLGGPGDQYRDSDVNLLLTVAQQVGVAAENATLFHETATRRREAETLYGLGMEITALTDVDEVLGHVLGSARELLGADVGLLSLLEEDKKTVVVRAASGLLGEALLGAVLPEGHGVAGYVVRTGQPLVVSDYLTDRRITHELDGVIRQEGLRTHTAVPVVARARTVGALTVAYRRVRPATEDEVRLLARMANQAAIAIENARLYGQVQSLAILEERDRLAREMHDSLGQSLGFLNLKAKLVEDLIESGRTHEAEEELAQMRRTIHEAYDEIRHAILGLRASGAREDLETTLRAQVVRFGEQARIPAEYDVRGPIPRIPALAAVQITRIVQEALTNVRKHANAASVAVVLSFDSGRLHVGVTDDGIGFDERAVQASSGARFGLETMRERAESIGGQFKVSSAPGKGTTVELSVPVA